ncbi:MAG: type II secretion system protein GspG [Spirochaetales bacterium]|nr:type II secretion system protein GspG [Spirochaetales bacterium]
MKIFKPVCFSIIIFFTLLFNACRPSIDYTRARRCIADISSLKTALVMYAMENNFQYPGTNIGLKVLVKYLDGTSVAADPWGHAYVYISPGVNPDRPYDLYSIGKNGIDEKGNGDDITSWGEVPSVYNQTGFEIDPLPFGIIVSMVVLLIAAYVLYVLFQKKIFKVCAIIVFITIVSYVIFLGSFFY